MSKKGKHYIKNEIMKILIDTNLKIERFKTPRTITGYQELISWSNSKRGNVEKLNQERNDNLSLDMMLTMFANNISDILVERLGEFWTGEHIIAYDDICKLVLKDCVDKSNGDIQAHANYRLKEKTISKSVTKDYAEMSKAWSNEGSRA
jgi:hypothetical protein